METNMGFAKMDILEFEAWITQIRVARTVLKIQQHHTYSPSYIHFKCSNHFKLQNGMKNYHVTHNGWSDIAQHFTTFPDGSVLTGRSLEVSPACIYGNNAQAVCIEHLGNFDKNGDIMDTRQKETVVRMTAALCRKFNLVPSVQTIVYHHWFNLSTGERNNGSKNNKSCPGANFFGGNKVTDCENYFLPLVKSLNNQFSFSTNSDPIMYACVDTDNLNIRSGPGADNALAADREPLNLGAILRVYDQRNGWYKVSSSAEHWVNGKFTCSVTRMIVKASSLNVRSGPSTAFNIIGSLKKGQEVFVSDQQNGWSQVAMDYRWIKTSFLST